MLLLLLYLFILFSGLNFCPLSVVQLENGLVEAVAVLISKMPRLRPESAAGNLGECFKSKPDFIKVYPNSAIL
jgi:nuclear pore complex protein Nup85